MSTLAGEMGSAGVDDADARFNTPFGIATFQNGDMFVADSYNHAIRYITAAGVVSTLAGEKGVGGVEDGTGTAARFNLPTTIAILSNGDMVVTDTGNNAVRYITVPNGVVSGLAGGFNNPYSVAALPNGGIVVADSNNHAIRDITTGSILVGGGEIRRRGARVSTAVAINASFDIPVY